MTNLEILLDENFNGLTLKSGDELIRKVRNYLDNNHTFLDKDMGLIIKISRASSFIMNSSNKLDDVLDKVYKLNREGVELYDGLGANYVKIFPRMTKENLLNTAGKSAKKRYQISRAEPWAKRWFDSYKLSAVISETKNEKFSAFNFMYAADAAKTLYFITRNPLWKSEAIMCYSKSLRYTKSNLNLKNISERTEAYIKELS